MKNNIEKRFPLFLFLILFCSLLGPGEVQCRADQHRILVILSELAEPYQSAFDFTISELSKLGYVQCHNFSFTVYSMDH